MKQVCLTLCFLNGTRSFMLDQDDRVVTELSKGEIPFPIQKIVDGDKILCINIQHVLYYEITGVVGE